MVACEPEERRGVGSGHCVVAAVISPINFSGEPFLLQLGVPVVLDVVVRSSGQLRCYDRPPASYFVVEIAYDIIFIFSETTMLDIWSQIIEPP